MLIALFIVFVSCAPMNRWRKELAVTKSSVPFYYPKSKFKPVALKGKDYKTGSNIPEAQQVQTGVHFLMEQLSLSRQDFEIVSHSKDKSAVVHVHIVRLINDYPIVNHRADVHLKSNKVISWSSTFPSHLQKRSDYVYPPVPAFDQNMAIQLAQDQMGNIPKVPNTPVLLEYVQIPDGSIVFCYVIQVASGKKWFKVFLDTQSGQIVHAVDYVYDLTFKAIPLSNTSPETGFISAVDPWHPSASPLGWNNDGNAYDDTRGNNAQVAYVDDAYANQFVKAKRGRFSFSWNPQKDPSDSNNRNAAVVNVFYVVNMLHDILYQYGFTEVTGNFQSNNFFKGGRGNDPVQVQVADPDDINNASFMTPPDGQSPIMRISVSTATNPNRDLALENSIIMHEFIHGVSSRMTGGPNTDQCLQEDVSRALSEGWSDTVAIIMTRKPNENRLTPFAIGAYAFNKPRGIRPFPYSTDFAVNPLTYESLSTLRGSHSIGSIWATMMNEIYWNLVEKYGHSSTIGDASTGHGNVILLKIVIEAFGIQPCNPDFIQARDAMFVADAVHYNSRHFCDLWKGFAKRGLGVSATSAVIKNAFDVPQACQ